MHPNKNIQGNPSKSLWNMCTAQLRSDDVSLLRILFYWLISNTSINDCVPKELLVMIIDKRMKASNWRMFHLIPFVHSVFSVFTLLGKWFVFYFFSSRLCMFVILICASQPQILVTKSRAFLYKFHFQHVLCSIEAKPSCYLTMWMTPLCHLFFFCHHTIFFK